MAAMSLLFGLFRHLSEWLSAADLQIRARCWLAEYVHGRGLCGALHGAVPAAHPQQAARHPQAILGVPTDAVEQTPPTSPKKLQYTADTSIVCVLGLDALGHPVLFLYLGFEAPARAPPGKQSDDCEDPGIYFDREFDIFRMVLHCGCGTQMLWSVNGVDWELGGAVQASGWCSGFNYTDGSGVGKLATRQRPHFVLDQAGRATHLTTGVNRPGDAGMGHTWTMAAKLL